MPDQFRHDDVATFYETVKVGTSIINKSAVENRHRDGITSPWNEKDLKFQAGYKRNSLHPVKIGERTGGERDQILIIYSDPPHERASFSSAF